MKYVLPLLALLLLIGGGCANTDTSTTTSSDEVQIEFEATDENTILLDEGAEIIDITLDGDPTTPLSDEMEINETFNEADEVLSLEMESGNFYFSPDTITASAGQEVEISFSSNTGFHTFVIDEIGLNETVVAGTTITFTAPDEPGTYAFYCDVGSHRAFGMEGTLTVQ